MIIFNTTELDYPLSKTVGKWELKIHKRVSAQQIKVIAYIHLLRLGIVSSSM